jgi:HTH-type transcriptional regulator, competence development regulator
VIDFRCVVYPTRNMKHGPSFGGFLRDRRLARAASDRAFSLRQLAGRVGIEPSYLSKIERGEQPPPGEETVCRIADELGEDRDALLAMAGKVSGDLLEIIRERPTLVAELLRAVRRAPAKRISEIAREVRDGEW